MSERQEHKKRYNLRLEYISKFNKWLEEEPPMILLWRWWKWKNDRPTYYCDHCGKELNEMHDYTEQEVGLIGYATADLCNECLHELDTYIKKFCKKEEE